MDYRIVIYTCVQDPTIEHCQSLLRATKWQSEVTLLSKDTAGAKNAGPTCPLNQKGRILTPCTLTPRDHVQAKQLIPSRDFIDHPWILPFARYSAMDDDHNVQPLLVEDVSKSFVQLLFVY